MDNQGVNFDLANLILYGKANPLDAIELLGPYVQGIHAKDGLVADNPKDWARKCPSERAKWIFRGSSRAERFELSWCRHHRARDFRSATNGRRAGCESLFGGADRVVRELRGGAKCENYLRKEENCAASTGIVVQQVSRYRRRHGR